MANYMKEVAKICGYECNNPNKEKYGADVCPKCGARMNERNE